VRSTSATQNPKDMELFEISPAEKSISLIPAEGREDPAVWVSKLAVFKNWPPNQDTLLREIVLRRGLNILWAKPTGATKEATRLGGHGAGKTTFCRLIRYVLSETTPGSDDFRESFNHKYGNGWVLAEVFLAGQRWLVGRSLRTRGHQSFALRDGALTDDFPDAPPRVGYDEYRIALDVAVFGEMKLRTLADSKKRLDWRRLVQWLARDQEAHFVGDRQVKGYVAQRFAAVGEPEAYGWRLRREDNFFPHPLERSDRLPPELGVGAEATKCVLRLRTTQE